MLSTARLSALRAVPRRAFIQVRHSSGRVEGSVAESKGFNKKEQAHENEYAHKHDIELLTKLKEQIEKKQAELASLEKKAEEVANSKK